MVSCVIVAVVGETVNSIYTPFAIAAKKLIRLEVNFLWENIITTERQLLIEFGKILFSTVSLEKSLNHSQLISPSKN